MLQYFVPLANYFIYKFSSNRNTMSYLNKEKIKMRIMQITNNQQNRPNFGVLKKPFPDAVQQFILKHVTSEGDEIVLINKAIAAVTEQQKTNSLYDIELVLKSFAEQGENVVAKILERSDSPTPPRVITEHALFSDGSPAIANTIINAGEHATLMKEMNSY